MTEERMKMIQPVLDTIENDDIKEFATVLIDNLPEYIWEVGASSTGKYHPAYSLGEGGLMRHQMAVVRFLNFFFELEQYQNVITSRRRDLLRIAGFVHDGRKSGTQEAYEKSKYTKFDHPKLMADEVMSYDGKYLNTEELTFIAKAINSHMGQWNVDSKTKVELPKPSNMYEEFVHLADYLASRKSLTMDFEHIEIPRPAPVKPEEYTLQFGKHKGSKLIDIYRRHPDYVVWLEENITRQDVLDAIKAVKGKITDEIDLEEDEL